MNALLNEFQTESFEKNSMFGQGFVNLDNMLNTQSGHWWFETPWRSYDVTVMHKAIPAD